MHPLHNSGALRGSFWNWRQHFSTYMAVMTGLPSWEHISKKVEPWAATRRTKAGDIPLTLYRDANSWCPFCHRVWFFMEAKRLRFSTEKIHLRGDKAEPPKQIWYRKLVPSGAVPAIRIGDEVVPESLDILYRLEKEFPSPCMLPKELENHIAKLAEMSEAFNTDGSEWLHNTRKDVEEVLLKDTMERLSWLENALSLYGGPFLCGQTVTLADAAYIGFLTRLAHNALYFKGLNIRDIQRFPRISSWFSAMEGLEAYQATKQDAFFEQRIYQAHPARRSGAEACMQLGATGSLVGEPDCSIQPKPPSAPFAAARMPALEAAAKICENRDALIHFLIRKHTFESHSKDLEALVDEHLRAIVGVLSGDLAPGDALHLVGGANAFTGGPARKLGNLIGTPRDMSSAALAQVRAAIQKMLETDKESALLQEWEAAD